MIFIKFKNIPYKTFIFCVSKMYKFRSVKCVDRYTKSCRFLINLFVIDFVKQGG